MTAGRVGIVTSGVSILGPRGTRVRLLNGELAGPGQADATGAIYRKGRLMGSGVLISSTAILTAGHCLRTCRMTHVAPGAPHAEDECRATAECVFCLPGVRSRPIVDCRTTTPDAETCCGSTPNGGPPAPDLVPDLAIAFLDAPILSVQPVGLPPSQGWKISDVKEARVSGFGRHREGENAFRTGLRRCAEVPVSACANGGMCLGNNDIELALNDSGGPTVCNAPFVGVIGISVRAPSEMIRISGNTRAWVEENLLNPNPNPMPMPMPRERELHILESEVILAQRYSKRIKPRLAEGEKLVVTLNSLDGDRVTATLLPAGNGKPKLCRKADDNGLQGLHRIGQTDQEVDIWYESCNTKTRVQIAYSRDAEPLQIG